MTAVPSITSRSAGVPLTRNMQSESSKNQQLDPQSLREQRQEDVEIRQLQARDRAVRAHEFAHTSVGGRYAGNANFTYQRGPDGVLYATGGEVPIDVSVVPGDPEATIEKMQVVRRAALAPLNPSAADRAVAAAASAKAARAAAELAKMEAEENETRGTSVDLLA